MAFLKIGCRALAFHIFKNLRLFDKKIVAGLGHHLNKLRGLSKKFVEFVNENKTTTPIAFKFVYSLDAFTTNIITKF